MRRTSLNFLLLAGFLISGGASAQTWDHPYGLSSGTFAGSTCNEIQQEDLFIEDAGYWLAGPYVVYDAVNLLLFPPLHSNIKAWTIWEYPQQGVDLSIWVCKNHSGDTAWNCIDGSDNYPYSPNWVEIPAQAGYYYVIVAGGIYGGIYPNCGSYTLSVDH